jgi:hypothetical protein
MVKGPAPESILHTIDLVGRLAGGAGRATELLTCHHPAWSGLAVRWGLGGSEVLSQSRVE